MVGDGFGWNELLRKSHYIKRGQRPAAHRENVRERIGCGDLAVSKRVVHDRGKEIHGLNKGAMSIDSINAGVVERVRVHEHVRVAIIWKLTQNLRQGLLAQFGCSPGTG